VVSVGSRSGRQLPALDPVGYGEAGYSGDGRGEVDLADGLVDLGWNDVGEGALASR
jgi:hypothetical protein